MTALQGLDARLRLSRLFLRTDARRRQGDLADFVAAVLAGGVDVVEIVQDDLDARTGAEVLEEVRGVAASAQAVVGVVGGPRWAGAVSADLLHLGATEERTREARAHLHPFALLGRSTHDPWQVDAALADDGLDFFSVGPASALDLVRHAARVAPVFDAASTPWFAVGGITADTLDAVLDAGARRVCVGSAVTAADDPQDAAARLARPLAQAWQADPAAERYRFAAAASRGRTR
ncbi:thiamine phosphate synthase [Microlunatus lacustris]